VCCSVLQVWGTPNASKETHVYAKKHTEKIYRLFRGSEVPKICQKRPTHIKNYLLMSNERDLLMSKETCESSLTIKEHWSNLRNVKHVKRDLPTSKESQKMNFRTTNKCYKRNTHTFKMTDNTDIHDSKRSIPKRRTTIKRVIERDIPTAKTLKKIFIHRKRPTKETYEYPKRQTKQIVDSLKIDMCRCTSVSV